MIKLPDFLIKNFKSGLNTLLASLIIYAVTAGTTYTINKVIDLLKKKLSGDSYNTLMNTLGGIKKIQDRLTGMSSFPSDILVDLGEEGVEEETKTGEIIDWIKSNLTKGEMKFVSRWIEKNIGNE